MCSSRALASSVAGSASCPKRWPSISRTSTEALSDVNRSLLLFRASVMTSSLSLAASCWRICVLGWPWNSGRW